MQIMAGEQPVVGSLAPPIKRVAALILHPITQ
jgi:hypothetical protein